MCILLTSNVVIMWKSTVLILLTSLFCVGVLEFLYICVNRLLNFFFGIFSISLCLCVFVPKSLATSSFHTDIPMLIYLVLTDTGLKPTTVDHFIVM